MRRRRHTRWFAAVTMICLMANIGLFAAIAVLQLKISTAPEMPSYCHAYDAEPPAIELNGPDSQTVVLGEEYHDQGAAVTDNCGDFDAIVSGEVDTSNTGDYYITYGATDFVGNYSEVSRLVRVIPERLGKIYLTFDDGPSQYTSKLLDVLAKYNVKATFFVTGMGDDELIVREHQEGHAIGLHSFSHDYAVIYRNAEAYFDDLNLIAERVKRLTGTESRLLRFPGGSSNTVSRKYDGGHRIMSYLVNEVERRGFTYFDWNVLSGDAGQTTNTDVVFHNVIDSLHEGGDSIVLQHDTKEFSIDAVERIIVEAQTRGYTFDILNIDSYPAHHGTNN